MQMRAGIYRVLRVVVVGAAALLAYRWLAPMGLGWLVLAIAGLAAAGWLGYVGWRARRERALDALADRAAVAVLDPPARPGAIRELTAACARARGRRPAEHARLTLVLATLLEADGDAEGALEALAEVGGEGLAPPLRAIVRHARAVAHLSSGDPEAARAALDAGAEPSGDAGVELRIRLLRGVIAAETGDPAEARRVAEEAREEALDDEDLRVEARVLEAVALDAAGEGAEAVARMRRLGDEMLDVLSVLGLPRVRALATRALAASTE
ncbi:MAG: hypothetical protein KF729_02980 [Sandaracinaceae bacterium]|nr:hypothetical protein [Sandaracinaceae bacterium]